MPQPLRTRYVFIDTSTFEQKNFEWNRRTLSSVAALAEKNQLRILTTNKTPRKILARIETNIEEAAQGLGTAKF